MTKAKAKTKQVKLTLANDYAQFLIVDADYKLDLPESGWLEIETADGGVFAVPVGSIIAVVTEGSGS